MRGAVLYGPRELRFEERDTPTIIKPTDAIIRMSATCVCGSDLWPYRGINPVPEPTPMGHEYCGIVEEVGSGVNSITPAQFVIGSFFASDNICHRVKPLLSMTYMDFWTTKLAAKLAALTANAGILSDDYPLATAVGALPQLQNCKSVGLEFSGAIITQ